MTIKDVIDDMEKIQMSYIHTALDPRVSIAEAAAVGFFVGQIERWIGKLREVPNESVRGLGK